MRHVRMLGLCLVAAMALAAVAASSALAGPEWGKCEKVGSGGNYTGKNCTKSEKAKPKGSGSYEWRKASEVAAKREAEGKSADVPFSGHSIDGGGILSTGSNECEGGTDELKRVTRQACQEAGGVIESNEGLSVYCEEETNTGETVGKNEVANIHVSFKGCTIEGGAPCKSAGASEGEINTNTLKGKLGWINKGAKEVGVLLEPVAKHGRFAVFTCFGGVIETSVGVGNDKEGAFYPSSGCIGACPGTTPAEEKYGGYDGIISPITPVNQMTNEFTQVFTSTETGAGALDPQNIPNKFEGKHIDLLEDYVVIHEGLEVEGSVMWSPASEEVTNVNTPEEEGEIKA